MRLLPPILRRFAAAFTLVELLVVIAIVMILAGLAAQGLTGARAKSRTISCVNNMRQLGLAWLMYAGENRERLAYNLGGDALRKTVAPKNPQNWVNGNMSWELDSDNTNTQVMLDSSLSTYVNKNPKAYKCPEDRALSDIQKAAGWKERARSYSMNAMVGNAGELSTTGTNVNNPYYKQFFSLAEIPMPSSIFVFIDEHPDSINDGYFLVKREYGQLEWMDLPGSHHRDGAVISFADGHVEIHRWIEPETKAPPEPDAAGLPRAIPNNRRTDFYWLLRRSSIPH